MHHKLTGAAAAALFAFSALAQAAEPGPPATAPTDGPTAKIICKRETVLGSRLPGPRVCKTAEQWKQNDRDAQDAVRRAQENRRSMDPGAG